MRFVKRHAINNNNPSANEFAVESDGRIVTDTTKSLRLPSGTTAQRYSTPVNGEVRYNTALGSGDIEAYVQGSWQRVLTNRQATITQNTFLNGDYSDTIFGPLAYQIDPSKPQNLLVIVDNVIQVATINYNLVNSSSGNLLTTSTNVTRTETLNTTTLHVANISNFNVGAVLSGNNVSGSVITAVSATSKTLKISPAAVGVVSSGTVITTAFGTGTYIVFTNSGTPVPSVPVIALQGFDGYGPAFTAS